MIRPTKSTSTLPRKGADKGKIFQDLRVGTAHMSSTCRSSTRNWCEEKAMWRTRRWKYLWKTGVRASCFTSIKFKIFCKIFIGIIILYLYVQRLCYLSMLYLSLSTYSSSLSLSLARERGTKQKPPPPQKPQEEEEEVRLVTNQSCMWRGGDFWFFLVERLLLLFFFFSPQHSFHHIITTTLLFLVVFSFPSLY